MKTRIIKQVIKKDGKISKRSVVIEPGKPYGFLVAEKALSKSEDNEARLESHSRLFWLMGICIVVLVILEVL